MEKVGGKLEQPRGKLMSLHEKLAELKLGKNELEVAVEEETSKWASQEQELLGLREELDRLKQDMKHLNANLKAETLAKNTVTAEMRLLREQLEELTQAGVRMLRNCIRFSYFLPQILQ